MLYGMYCMALPHHEQHGIKRVYLSVTRYTDQIPETVISKEGWLSRRLSQAVTKSTKYCWEVYEKHVNRLWCDNSQFSSLVTPDCEKKFCVSHWDFCCRYFLQWERWRCIRKKNAVVQFLWNFEFIWLRSGVQVNPCIRSQPTTL